MVSVLGGFVGRGLFPVYLLSVCWLSACGGKSDTSNPPTGGRGGAETGGAGPGPSGGSAMGGSTSGGSAGVSSGGVSTGGLGPARGGAGANGASAGAGGSSAGHAGANSAGTAGTNGGRSNLGGAGGTSGGESAGNAGAPNAAGQGGSAGSVGMPGTIADLMEVVAAFCQSARTCCSKAAMEMNLDDCEDKLLKEQPAASLKGGSVLLDREALSACVAAYQQAATDCEENPVVKACEGVFIGTNDAGESCSDNGRDCRSDKGTSTCLITAQNGTMGVCTQVPHGKAGDPCVFTCRSDESCQTTTFGSSDVELTLCFENEGLYCNYTLSPAVCQPLVGMGQPCDLSDACGTNGICDQTCKPVGKEGDTCGNCRHDLTCLNGHCVSPPFASVNSCDGHSFGP
jgi:hypothetical protein